MPDAKNNAKLTGDTHPPEVEGPFGPFTRGRPKALGARATPASEDLSPDLENEGRAGKGVDQADDLRDKAPGSGGYRQR